MLNRSFSLIIQLSKISESIKETEHTQDPDRDCYCMTLRRERRSLTPIWMTRGSGPAEGHQLPEAGQGGHAGRHRPDGHAGVHQLWAAQGEEDDKILYCSRDNSEPL